MVGEVRFLFDLVDSDHFFSCGHQKYDHTVREGVAEAQGFFDRVEHLAPLGVHRVHFGGLVKAGVLGQLPAGLGLLAMGALYVRPLAVQVTDARKAQVSR